MLKRNVCTNIRTYTHANIQTYIKTVLATLTRSSLFLIKEMTKTMHTTHIHTTLFFTLSYSLLFFFWGGGGGGGAPLLCVRTFSCKCMCVCMWTVTTTTKGKAFRPAATATTMSTGASFCLFERRATTKKNLNRNFNVAAGVVYDDVFQYGFFFAALVSCQFHQWFLKIRN